MERTRDGKSEEGAAGNTVVQCIYRQGLGFSPKMTLWLYKRTIIPNCRMGDIMDIALVWSKLERLQRTACIMITEAMRTTPTKVLEMLLDLPTLKMAPAVESTALTASYRLPRPDLRNLGIGHNWICAKADKVNSKFSTIKNHVIPRRSSYKYWIGIPTREEWEKNWPNQLRKGISGLQMESVISKGLVQKFATTKANSSGTFHWNRCYNFLGKGCDKTGPCD